MNATDGRCPSSICGWSETAGPHFRESAVPSRDNQHWILTGKDLVGDYFARETVFAGGSIKNKGLKTHAFQYFVAFYDREHKLVGCSTQSSFKEAGLKQGEEIHLGSSLIKLPKGKHKEITFFEAILYEEEPLIKGN